MMVMFFRVDEEEYGDDEEDDDVNVVDDDFIYDDVKLPLHGQLRACCCFFKVYHWFTTLATFKKQTLGCNQQQRGI